MQGVTPPHIYDLTPREALFHGVPALRLNPVGGEDKIFGRTGLLAHTYMTKIGGVKRKGLFVRELSGDRPYFIFEITKARYQQGGRALVE